MEVITTLRRNRDLAELPPDAAPLALALAQLRSMAEAWEGATIEQPNRLCREFIQSVTLNTKSRDAAAIELTPHPELAPLFGARRDFVWRIQPRQDSKVVPRSAPNGFAVADLLARETRRAG